MTALPRRPRRLGPALQLAPASAFYAIFFLAPLAVLVGYSFFTFRDYQTVSELTLDNYTAVLETDAFRSLFLRTVGYAALVSVIVLALAYPFAYALTFVFPQRRHVIYFLVLVSMFGGYLVRIYAWRTMLGNNGLLNGGLISLGVLDEPARIFLNSPFAIVVVLVNFLLPFGVLPIYNAMQNVSPGLIEASRDLGAGRLHALRTVVLPMTMRGATAALAFTFIAAAAEWVTPQLVGGTGDQFVGSQIAFQFGSAVNWPLGAALAMTLIVAVGALVGVGMLLLRWLAR